MGAQSLTVLGELPGTASSPTPPFVQTNALQAFTQTRYLENARSLAKSQQSSELPLRVRNQHREIGTKRLPVTKKSSVGDVRSF
jgi:hypothetical protein